MIDNPGQHFFAQGEAAYDAGDLVTALRWWLRGVDVGHEESLTAALEVSATDEKNHPWDHLLYAMRQVQDASPLSSILSQQFEETHSGPASEGATNPVATWSQFTLSPVDDLVTDALPLGRNALSADKSDDPEMRRILEYLEYRGIIFEPLGSSYVVGNWQSEFEWSVPIFFGIEPAGIPRRHLRIFTPLLIGLPAPEMAPNLGPDSPLPQAGFSLPLRPMQVLFALGCMQLATPPNVGFASLLSSMRFAGVPEGFVPTPRISAGQTGWIIGPDAIYPLRSPLPQVSVGYEIDLALSGPHLDAAVPDAIDALVAAVAKANEACESQSGIFCEYITSITNLVARKQWADLFADFVYPATFAEATILAESGDPAAMVDLGSMLTATPGLEGDAQQWLDMALAWGFAPALASKTWSLLAVEQYDQVLEEWTRHHERCENATNEAAEPDKIHLLENLRSAQANAAIAEFLRGGNATECQQTWEALIREGHVGSRIYRQVAPLMGNTRPSPADYVDAGRNLAHTHADSDWLGPTYLTIAHGLQNGAGDFKEWCRRALEVCLASGLPVRLTAIASADEARMLARSMIDSGEETLGAALQEAATRLGLPYAGADHSWRMLEQGRFQEALTLFNEVATKVEALVATIGSEFPDQAQVWEREWANYQSNIALCHIASGQSDAWALEIWRSGATTGNVESIFYPAVIALRSGDRAAAQEIVGAMAGDKLAEMTVIALEGSRSAAPFWREWSQDGLRLLQAGESLGSTPAPLSGSLSSHKGSPGLSSSGLGITGSADPSFGSSLPHAPGASTEEYRFCPQCGEPRVPGGRFCAGCGFAYA